MNNITLIGMPGVGKSTIGVVLAKVLGYEFMDSDLLIQRQEKRRLHQIIEQEGVEGFKAIENRVNASIETENTVIATGGSVVYCSEAMEHLRSIGKVVYLRLSLESLEKRLIKKYMDQHKTHQEIEKILDVSRATLDRKMVKYGLR